MSKVSKPSPPIIPIVALTKIVKSSLDSTLDKPGVFSSSPQTAFTSNRKEANEMEAKLEGMIEELAGQGIKVDQNNNVWELYGVLSRAILQFKMGIMSREEFYRPNVESKFFQELKVLLTEVGSGVVRTKEDKDEGMEVVRRIFCNFGEPLSSFKLKKDTEN